MRHFLDYSPTMPAPLLTRIAHGVWLAGLALTAPALLAAAPQAAAVYAGLAVAAAPGLIGLLFARQLGNDFIRFCLLLAWTGAAFAAAAVLGGLSGPAVFAFLLAPAVAAAGGTRRHVIEAAVLSLLAAPAAAALQAFGMLTPAQPAWGLLAPAAALTAALGFGFGGLRLLRAYDASRAEAGASRLRRQAFDAAPAALAAVGPDGRILAGSAGLRTLSPGLPRQLDGLPLAELGYDEAARAALKPPAPGGAPSQAAVRGPGGRKAEVMITAAAAPFGAVTLLRPVNAAEAEAAQQTEALARERDAARAEAQAKTEFLAAVSHEIRTPLNAIIGFSDVMKARLFGPMPARYAEYADLIHESGRHLLDLIGDVLDMSRIEADRYELHSETFDAAEVAALCTKLMRQRAEDAGLTLQSDAVGPLTVTADRKALRQILLNLLSNAVKFTPRGGAVVLMARADGGDLVLAVGDSGVGIAEEDLKALGQPFRQAASARDVDQRGSGLGLSLVRSLAMLHGGEMTIESRPGEGTTVTVRLPVMDRPQIGAGDDDGVTPLEVHERIRKAQEAGRELLSAPASAAGAA